MQVKPTLHARDFIEGLATVGRPYFSSKEAQKALGISSDAAKLALNRLAKQRLVASPARGFYVIIPPEYRTLGCLPADQFIPELMNRLGVSYYAGLLSAAQYHGAAHHRPQEFQVMVAMSRRPIVCGAVRVAFIARKRISEIPVQSFNTPRGTISVSTPEATSVDLVGYYNRVGGLDQVATILKELAEALDPGKLTAVAQTAPIPWAQRLGYLLEQIQAGDRAQLLKDYVKTHAREAAALLPKSLQRKASYNPDWKLYVNADVEPEL